MTNGQGPSRPPIVYLTPIAPRPSDGGSGIRSGATLTSLAMIGPVEVVLVGSGVESMSTAIDDLADEFVHDVRLVAAIPAQTAGRLRRAIATATTMMSPKWGNWLLPPLPDQACSNTDALIWTYKSSVFDAYRIQERTHHVVDLDDLDERTLPKRPIRRFVAGWVRARARRRRIVRCAVTTLVGSEVDLARIGSPRTVEILRNTYPEVPGRVARRALGGGHSTTPTVTMIGLMHYGPNRDGARWFVRNCWPRVRDACPAARLRIVGDGGTGLFDGHEPGVDIVGKVPRVDDELTRADVMVVPIHYGSGTRIKILEAFVWGVPVVTTSLGAEGIDVVDGVSARVSDSPVGFADAVVELLGDPGLRDRLAVGGSELFSRDHAPERFTAQVHRVVGPQPSR